MKKINDVLRNNIWVLIPITLLIGLLIGYTWSGESGPEQSSSAHEHEAGEIYTCSMHPQIRSEVPGSCPICGMDLTPVVEDDSESLDFEITFSDAAMKLADIQTAEINFGAVSKDIILPGRIEADERRINEISAHFPGRIETLNVNFTGQTVKKGQVLAVVYAPELVSAQKELFEAVKMKETNPSVYRAARNKFKLWEFTDNQIDRLERSAEVQYNFRILSPISGTVIKRNLAKGDHVVKGTSMFQVVDLSRIWVLLDAYETELPFINVGNEVEFEIKAAPGKNYSGQVSFIDPVMDRQKRTSIVRVELNNRDQLLKPGMLAKGILKAGFDNSKDRLLVPKSAVLWTGKRAVVYVKSNATESSAFAYREIQLGEEIKDFYVVLEGLRQGEFVATNGVFKIDAATQLQGKRSMMTEVASTLQNGGHNHNSMMKKEETSNSSSVKPKSPPRQAMTNIGDSHVHIEYHAPGARGRGVSGN